MTIAVDQEGYLQDLASWNEAVAAQLADGSSIQLTDDHWALIHLVRAFYETYERSPAMRPLVKWVKQHLGDTKGNSLYLMQLFPGNPAKVVARIAGLPRPTNCI